MHRLKVFVLWVSIQVFSISMCVAQKNLIAQDRQSSPFVFQKQKPANCASQTALLIHEIKGKTALKELQTKYPVVSTSAGPHIPVLMKVSPSIDHSVLRDLNISINTKAGRIYSALVPLDHLISLSAMEGIEYLEIAHDVYPRLDKALKESKVDLIHQGMNLSQSYTGKDVVIGIVDFGFDYSHPTFRSQDGSEFRVKRVWDQVLMGTPPAGFSYGHELTDEQEMLLNQTDEVRTGHGTHVAGICGGSGEALSDLYRGVAYESDLVFVSPRNTLTLADLSTGIVDGINYTFQYAESVGKPAVVNVSQGHHTGPHDGTSLTDQAIDALSGTGKIVVGAVGNEGDPSGFYLHFHHDFAQNDTILSYVVFPDGVSSGETFIDIWGEVGTNFRVGFNIYNPKTKELENYSPYFNTENSIIGGAWVPDKENDSLYVEGAIETNPLNNRPHAFLYVNNTQQAQSDDVDFNDLLNNDFILLEIISDNTRVHAWSADNSGEAFFTDLSGIGADEFAIGSRIIGGNPDYTMGELGGTANSIISVGCYISKNEWMNTNGELVQSDDILETIFRSSSRGPTVDGRIKPDISAPGGLISSAENSFNIAYNTFVETDQVSKPAGGNWSYGVRGGTSFSSPMVAGIVALLLEMNPDLSPSDIKDLLIDHGVEDNFTGNLPNNTWGYGKVNAHAMASSLDMATRNSSIRLAPILVYPNPAQDLIYFPTTKERLTVNILDAQGRLVIQHNLEANSSGALEIPGLENGIYFLHMAGKNINFQTKLMIVK